MTPQERAQQTEVIPAVPQAAPLVDPFPPNPGRVGESGYPMFGRRSARGRSGTVVGFVLQLVAYAVVAIVAFVGGQVTTTSGVVPPPPVTRPAAEVQTEAQMARVWPAMAHPDQATVCRSWAAGEWREYITDRWVQHLHSPAGGGIDVDRATVAEFIGRVCARGG